jgi:hypothetical protein
VTDQEDGLVLGQSKTGFKVATACSDCIHDDTGDGFCGAFRYRPVCNYSAATGEKRCVRYEPKETA